MLKYLEKHRPIALIALIAAWLVPGAGHVYVNRPIRGLIIFLVITATFWAGIGIGGVMTVDPQNERWWYIAEMLTGANGLVAWQRQEAAVSRLKQGRLDELSRELPEMLRQRDELLRKARTAQTVEDRDQAHETLNALGEKYREAEKHQRELLAGNLETERYVVEQELAREGMALVPPVATAARAYAGVAGLLNLMCIFDAVLVAMMRSAKMREERKK